MNILSYYEAAGSSTMKNIYGEIEVGKVAVMNYSLSGEAAAMRYG